MGLRKLYLQAICSAFSVAISSWIGKVWIHAQKIATNQSIITWLSVTGVGTGIVAVANLSEPMSLLLSIFGYTLLFVGGLMLTFVFVVWSIDNALRLMPELRWVQFKKEHDTIWTVMTRLRDANPAHYVHWVLYDIDKQYCLLRTRFECKYHIYLPALETIYSKESTRVCVESLSEILKLSKRGRLKEAIRLTLGNKPVSQTVTAD